MRGLMKIARQFLLHNRAGAATDRVVGEDAEVPPSLDLGLERRGVARVTEPRGDMVVASDSLHLTVDGGRARGVVEADGKPDEGDEGAPDDRVPGRTTDAAFEL